MIFPDQTLNVMVIDLSLKGALIRLPAGTTAKEGTVCKLHIPLHETHHKISMEARVAHVEGRYAGILCQAIDIYSITHLRRLIELNLGDPAQLGHELYEMLAGKARALPPNSLT